MERFYDYDDEDRTVRGGFKTTYWVKDFIKAYGVERDNYYRKRFGYYMPFPRDLGVPTDIGINSDSLGRLYVTVTDTPNISKMKIPDALEKVNKLLAGGHR